MAIPTSNICYGPVSDAYAPGGGIHMPAGSGTIHFNVGNTFTLGIEKTERNGGSGGQATKWRFYKNGSYVGDGPIINVPSTGPQQWTLTINPGDAGDFQAHIWTDANAYGVKVTDMWWTSSVCSGTLPPCVPQLKAGQDTQVFVTDTLINAVLALVGNSFVKSLIAFTAGTVINIEDLCTTLPPEVPEPNGSMWGSPALMAYWGGRYLHAFLWWYFCECAPGTTPPLPVDPPIYVDPPGRPDDPVYTPGDPGCCPDLLEIRRKLDQLLSITSSDLELDRLVQRYGRPFGTIPGAVHAGLTGSGSFEISRLIGLRVAAADASPEGTLEGNPGYQWNLGWMSVSDGGAMLQERRITRSSEDWLPVQGQLATVFGYFCKPGVTLTVTELEAEP